MDNDLRRAMELRQKFVKKYLAAYVDEVMREDVHALTKIVAQQHETIQIQRAEICAYRFALRCSLGRQSGGE